jgi:SnoaL-like domain
VDRGELTEWLHAYERAWRTPGTAPLAELFAPHATYRTAPYEHPYRGLEEIAEMWERERAGAEEAFQMSAEVVAAEGDTGVARVEVTYDDPPRIEYRDLWIVRLDESGRCIEFEEWPFWPPGQEGHWPPGPQADAGLISPDRGVEST